MKLKELASSNWAWPETVPQSPTPHPQGETIAADSLAEIPGSAEKSLLHCQWEKYRKGLLPKQCGRGQRQREEAEGNDPFSPPL